MGEHYLEQCWLSSAEVVLTLARHGHIALTSCASVSPSLKVPPGCVHIHTLPV